MRTVLCSSCVCQLLLKNFMMMMRRLILRCVRNSPRKVSLAMRSQVPGRYSTQRSSTISAIVDLSSSAHPVHHIAAISMFTGRLGLPIYTQRWTTCVGLGLDRPADTLLVYAIRARK